MFPARRGDQVSIRRLESGRWEWRHRVDGRHLKRTFDRRADAVRHDTRVRARAARAHERAADWAMVASDIAATVARWGPPSREEARAVRAAMVARRESAA